MKENGNENQNGNPINVLLYHSWNMKLQPSAQSVQAARQEQSFYFH